jgi:hypothetical protein
MFVESKSITSICSSYNCTKFHTHTLLLLAASAACLTNIVPSSVTCCRTCHQKSLRSSYWMSTYVFYWNSFMITSEFLVSQTAKPELASSPESGLLATWRKMAATGSKPLEILQNKRYIRERSSTCKEATLSVYKSVLWKYCNCDNLIQIKQHCLLWTFNNTLFTLSSLNRASQPECSFSRRWFSYFVSNSCWTFCIQSKVE